MNKEGRMIDPNNYPKSAKEAVERWDTKKPQTMQEFIESNMDKIRAALPNAGLVKKSMVRMPPY